MSLDAAALNFALLKTPRRQVCIRRDHPEFVVAFHPDNVVVFRHQNAHALRRLCWKLRWEIVADIMPEANDPATW
jgi:hypothetical protein